MLCCPLIHLEPVGGEQQSVLNTAALQGVEKHSLDVTEVAPSDHQTDPKPGPHFQGCQDPDHPLLSPYKAADLVGLKFMDDKPFEPPKVEPECVVRRQFKPPSDGSPGDPFDSSYGGDADAVYTQVDDFIEQRSGFVQPVVGSAVGRAECSAAFLAAEATASALRRGIERVANDVALAELPSQGTIGVGTSAR